MVARTRRHGESPTGHKSLDDVPRKVKTTTKRKAVVMESIETENDAIPVTKRQRLDDASPPSASPLPISPKRKMGKLVSPPPPEYRVPSEDNEAPAAQMNSGTEATEAVAANSIAQSPPRAQSPLRTQSPQNTPSRSIMDLGILAALNPMNIIRRSSNFLMSAKRSRSAKKPVMDSTMGDNQFNSSPIKKRTSVAAREESPTSSDPSVTPPQEATVSSSSSTNTAETSSTPATPGGISADVEEADEPVSDVEKRRQRRIKSMREEKRKQDVEIKERNARREAANLGWTNPRLDMETGLELWPHPSHPYSEAMRMQVPGQKPRLFKNWATGKIEEVPYKRLPEPVPQAASSYLFPLLHGGVPPTRPGYPPEELDRDGRPKVDMLGKVRPLYPGGHSPFGEPLYKYLARRQGEQPLNPIEILRYERERRERIEAEQEKEEDAERTRIQRIKDDRMIAEKAAERAQIERDEAERAAAEAANVTASLETSKKRKAGIQKQPGADRVKRVYQGKIRNSTFRLPDDLFDSSDSSDDGSEYLIPQTLFQSPKQSRVNFDASTKTHDAGEGEAEGSSDDNMNDLEGQQDSQAPDTGAVPSDDRASTNKPAKPVNASSERKRPKEKWFTPQPGAAQAYEKVRLDAVRNAARRRADDRRMAEERGEVFDEDAADAAEAAAVEAASRTRKNPFAIARSRRRRRDDESDEAAIRAHDEAQNGVAVDAVPDTCIAAQYAVPVNSDSSAESHGDGSDSDDDALVVLERGIKTPQPSAVAPRSCLKGARADEQEELIALEHEYAEDNQTAIDIYEDLTINAVIAKPTSSFEDEQYAKILQDARDKLTKYKPKNPSKLHECQVISPMRISSKEVSIGGPWRDLSEHLLTRQEQELLEETWNWGEDGAGRGECWGERDRGTPRSEAIITAVLDSIDAERKCLEKSH